MQSKIKEQEYIESPLNYMGSKYKILDQLLPLFPKDIDLFLDLFTSVVEKQEIINRSINELYHVLLDWVKENIDNMSVWTKKNLATLYFQKGKWNKMISRSEAYSLFCK